MGPGGNAFATDSATSELPTRYRQIGQYTIEMGSPLTAWCGGISGCVRKLIDGLFQLTDIIAPLISIILTKLYSAKGSHCGWRSVYSVGKTAIKRRRIKMLFLGNVKERCQLRLKHMFVHARLSEKCTLRYSNGGTFQYSSLLLWKLSWLRKGQRLSTKLPLATTMKS